MKLSLWCLMHYRNFDALLADKAIAVNGRIKADCDIALGDTVVTYIHGIGLQFDVVNQDDINTSKTFGKEALADESHTEAG